MGYLAAAETRRVKTVVFAWKGVAAAFVVVVFGWGVGFYGPAVFLNVLHQQRGWPLSAISAAIAVPSIGAGDTDIAP